MAADKKEAVCSDELPQTTALSKLKKCLSEPIHPIRQPPPQKKKKDFCLQLWVYSIWDGWKQQLFEFSKGDSGILPISEGNFEIGRDAGPSQVVKNPPASASDPGSIPGSGRSPGGENGNLLQYSCPEIPWTEEPGEPYTRSEVTQLEKGRLQIRV